MHRSVAFIITLLLAGGAMAAPKAVSTEVLGPWVGEQAPLHTGNIEPHRIVYYGTDLGFTYEHGGLLHILFGDTYGTEDGTAIEASSGDRLDDSFGTVDLVQWSDPTRIQAGNLPPVLLGQNPDSAEAAAIDPGHAMEGFKTPEEGFSNGTEQFGFFYAGKPLACTKDTDCSNGLTCDTELGYVGVPASTDAGPTFGCRDGSHPQCNVDTLFDAEGKAISGSGFCVDTGSTIWGEDNFGRVNGMAAKMLIGLRDEETPKIYRPTRTWWTNRFLNTVMRTVERFDPEKGQDPSAQDFSHAKGFGDQQRVFMWGRPAFIGLGSQGRSVGLYFAYVDMPHGEDFEWKPQYFSGLDDSGIPQFSPREQDAIALDLDSTQPGMQPEEPHDIANQQTVTWIEPLGKWVMFYGGGLTDIPYLPNLPTCGVLELFMGPDCTQVDLGNGAFRMRTADAPWGPWSPPQDLIVGGDPKDGPLGQYGPGGMLRHPECTEPECAPSTDARDVNPLDYGFFYSANIIEQWTQPAGNGVDVIWNASTWNPYRVILLRTRIEP